MSDEWEMTACESCDENFEREFEMCIDGEQYGQCEWPTCGGVCIHEYKCPCRCHR